MANDEAEFWEQYQRTWLDELARIMEWIAENGTQSEES